MWKALRAAIFAALISAAPAHAQWISNGQGGGGGGGGTPGGSSGQIQYNNAGAFGGRAPSGNGTTIATTTGTLTSGDLAGIDANGNIIDAGQSATPQFNNQTGTSYTIACSDLSKIVTLSNASPVAVTLPQAGTSCFTSGFFLASIQNIGAGLVTITPTTSTINGAASLTLSTNQSVSIVSNGTNYYAQGVAVPTAPGGTNGQVQVNASGAFGGLAKSGSGSVIASATAAGASDNCAKWDASGNVADAGGPCGYRVSQVTGSIQYYPVWPQMITASGATLSITTQYCAPFVLNAPQHWDQVSVYMTTGAGSTGIQIALYSDATDANGRHYPATVLANSATIADTGSAGNLTWSLTSQALPAGMSWLCFQMGDTTAKYLSLNSGAGGSQYIAGLLGSASLSDVVTSGALITGLSYTSTFGTWANQSAVGTILKSTAVIPNAGYRLASVP